MKIKEKVRKWIQENLAIEKNITYRSYIISGCMFTGTQQPQQIAEQIAGHIKECEGETYSYWQIEGEEK
jgi:acyl carrier protein